MLDRIALFGARSDKLQNVRRGKEWIAFGPAGIDGEDLQTAAEAVRRAGGVLVRAQSSGAPTGVTVTAAQAPGYHPPKRMLTIDETGQRWTPLGAAELPAGHCLVVPADLAAEQAVERLQALLTEFPEDREALVWQAISRPQELFQAGLLQEQKSRNPTLGAAPEPAAPPSEGKPWALIGGALALGLLLGAGGALLPGLLDRESPPPDPPAKAEPATPLKGPVPALSATDLKRIDDAVAASARKGPAMESLRADGPVAGLDYAGFVTLARLELLRHGTEPKVEALSPSEVIEKALAAGLEPHQRALLTQYACDGPGAGGVEFQESGGEPVQLPPSFGVCAEDPESADKVRQGLYVLRDFLREGK